MRTSAGQHLLRILGGLCLVVGFLAWIGLAWTAISDPDGATPQGEASGPLMAWALTGTVLMIVGMVLLHVAAGAVEQEQRRDRPPPR